MNVAAVIAGRKLSAAPPVEAVRERILLFTVGTEILGMGIQSVRQVTPAPAGVEGDGFGHGGRFLYRGVEIPLLSLASLWGWSHGGARAAPHVIVVEEGSHRWGLLVDEVREIVEVDRERIDPMPEAVTLVDPRYFRGVLPWSGRVVILIDERGVTQMVEQEIGGNG